MFNYAASGYIEPDVSAPGASAPTLRWTRHASGWQSGQTWLHWEGNEPRKVRQSITRLRSARDATRRSATCKEYCAGAQGPAQKRAGATTGQGLRGRAGVRGIAQRGGGGVARVSAGARRSVDWPGWARAGLRARGGALGRPILGRYRGGASTRAASRWGSARRGVGCDVEGSGTSRAAPGNTGRGAGSGARLSTRAGAAACVRAATLAIAAGRGGQGVTFRASTPMVAAVLVSGGLAVTRFCRWNLAATRPWGAA